MLSALLSALLLGASAQQLSYFYYNLEDRSKPVSFQKESGDLGLPDSVKNVASVKRYDNSFKVEIKNKNGLALRLYRGKTKLNYSWNSDKSLKQFHTDVPNVLILGQQAELRKALEEGLEEAKSLYRKASPKEKPTSLALALEIKKSLEAVNKPYVILVAVDLPIYVFDKEYSGRYSQQIALEKSNQFRLLYNNEHLYWGMRLEDKSELGFLSLDGPEMKSFSRHSSRKKIPLSGNRPFLVVLGKLKDNTSAEWKDIEAKAKALRDLYKVDYSYNPENSNHQNAVSALRTSLQNRFEEYTFGIIRSQEDPRCELPLWRGPKEETI